jgi:hypothetical protein
MKGVIECHLTRKPTFFSAPQSSLYGVPGPHFFGRMRRTVRNTDKDNGSDSRDPVRAVTLEKAVRYGNCHQGH